MPSVILTKNGADRTVKSPRSFVNLVYGTGWLPKVGTVAQAWETLTGGFIGVPGLTLAQRVQQLEELLEDGVGGGSNNASDLTQGFLSSDRIAAGSLPTNKLQGTLSDAQVPSGITRDTELAAALAALVASAPGTLDTLDELAAALGDDPNFAATLTALVGSKVAKTGNETIAGTKTFSSSPVVPTPTTASQAAPKSYVDDAVTNAGGAFTPTIANAAPGTIFSCYKASGTWPARPTARADITVFWIGASPAPASATSGTAGMRQDVDVWIER